MEANKEHFFLEEYKGLSPWVCIEISGLPSGLQFREGCWSTGQKRKAHPWLIHEPQAACLSRAGGHDYYFRT